MPNLIANLVVLAAGQLSQAQRLQGLRSLARTGGGGGALAAALYLLLAVAAAALAILLVRGLLHRRRTWRGFDEHARRLGLRPEERELLALVARTARLRPPEAMFSSEAAFDAGVGKLLAGPRIAGLSPEMRESTRSLMALLREKLGFQRPPEEHPPLATYVSRIPVGTRLDIYRKGGSPDRFLSEVVGGGGPLEIVVRPEAQVAARAGDFWIVRYDDGGLLWECSGTVANQLPEGVVVRLQDTAQCVNRRRFARVPVRRQAFVAAYSHMKLDETVQAPQFLPARLVELGGPGLLLESALELPVGEKLLVVLRFDGDHVLQGFGRICRSDAGEGGMCSLAVELMGLSTGEVGELARQTQQAQRALEEAAALHAGQAGRLSEGALA